MRLLITGVTRTGNLGGGAMLCSVEQVLKPYCDDFALCSILPAQDAAQAGPDSARIVNSDYRYLLLVIAPLCLLFWPFRRLNAVRWLLSRLSLLKDVSRADAIVDLSGIAFVDGRGLPLLYYNVANVLPGFFFDIPVYKLSQAVGPFRQLLNATLARWAFNRCRTVVARGSVSLDHLRELGIEKSVHFPDTSFALRIPEDIREKAKATVDDASSASSAGKYVICSPSAVVRKKCEKAGIDMARAFAEAMDQLILRGIRVALLPHSTNTGIRKNDDLAVARQIVAYSSHGADAIPILEADGDPRMARALIGTADAFVATRFHSLIAALSQSVPTVTVGWSHKYREAAEPFEMDRYTVDYSALTADRLVEMVLVLLDRGAELKTEMLPVAEQSSIAATEGIRLVLEGRGA